MSSWHQEAAFLETDRLFREHGRMNDRGGGGQMTLLFAFRIGLFAREEFMLALLTHQRDMLKPRGVLTRFGNASFFDQMGDQQPSGWANR